VGKAYRHTAGKRFGNAVLTRVVRSGRGPKAMRVVTVRGRRTGNEYSTPIWVMDRADGRYWVSTFGETETVKNARAAGRVTLRRGDAVEDVRLVEIPPSDRVPFLRAYMDDNRSRMARTYFGATPKSTDEELAALAPQRAVFRLEPI
jgi:hypothetical protein